MSERTRGVLDTYHIFMRAVRVGGELQISAGRSINQDVIMYECWWVCEARRGVGHKPIGDRCTCQEGELQMCGQVSPDILRAMSKVCTVR
jgi:hypothetical protein